MSERKINLKEIANKVIDSTSEDMVIACMREACKQVLELAAENAKTKQRFQFDEEAPIDKQSILDTIKQVE